MKKIHVLLIDDHPITVEAYRNALELMSYDFIFVEAYDIDMALNKVKCQPKILPFDIAFVDISLPESKTTRMTSGEELALSLKKQFPNIKIIIPTLIKEVDRIHFIIKTVNPDALLLKTDAKSLVIQKSINTVLKNERYYSKGVKTILNHRSMDIKNVHLKILYCLSNQIKVKDMKKHILLSLRSIERRKSELHDFLNVPAGNNELLVKKAKEKGLL